MEYPKMLYKGPAFPDGETYVIPAGEHAEEEEGRLLRQGWRLTPDENKNIVVKPSKQK